MPVSRSTAWRWVQEAVLRAERDGLIERGRRIGTHTLRHSYARHLSMSGVGINYVSRWLGPASIKPTLCVPGIGARPGRELGGGAIAPLLSLVDGWKHIVGSDQQRQLDSDLQIIVRESRDQRM